jgi:hypothetical protein
MGGCRDRLRLFICAGKDLLRHLSERDVRINEMVIQNFFVNIR